VGHGAERTGPPIFLLHLQRWLHEQRALAFETVLARGGDLVPEYEALGPVHVVDGRWTTPRVVQAGLGRAGRARAAATVAAARRRVRLSGVGEHDLLYLNTAAPGVLAAGAALAGSAPILSHVHELELGLRYGLDDRERSFLLDRSDHFVAASQAVADNLVASHGVDLGRISVHHEVIDGSARPDERRAQHLAADLGIPDGAPVVVACGVTDLRKAPDLFVQLAWELDRRRADDDLHLLWVGGPAEGPFWWPLANELARLGLADRVHITGIVDHPLDALSLGSVFVLCSREDAFPLASLEAASLELPIVCFDAGGAPELVQPHEAGVVVPLPDVAAMAEAVLGLLDDPARRQALGENARGAVAAHHDVHRAGPALVETMRAVAR